MLCGAVPKGTCKNQRVKSVLASHVGSTTTGMQATSKGNDGLSLMENFSSLEAQPGSLAVSRYSHLSTVASLFLSPGCEAVNSPPPRERKRPPLRRICRRSLRSRVARLLGWELSPLLSQSLLPRRSGWGQGGTTVRLVPPCQRPVCRSGGYA